MIELEKMVVAAKNGDLKAYEKIIESFKPMAVGYSFSILKDRDNAEDAVQESFIEAYYNLGSLKQPVKLCTAGRVFRPNKEDTTHSKVFHQYEIMEIGEGITKETMKNLVENIIRHILSNIEMRFIEFKYPGYNCSYDFEVRKDGVWISVGGCGMMNIDLLKRYKIDSEIYSGYGIGLGLERLAMIKYGINNIDDLIEN